eukprot:6462338-Amphidinium_carterae.1
MVLIELHLMQRPHMQLRKEAATQVQEGNPMLDFLQAQEAAADRDAVDNDTYCRQREARIA